MLKLIKYLKPYIGAIILAVILLYTQVNMDLALPDLMSKIINTGIQQSGIDDVIPEILRDDLYISISQEFDGKDLQILESIYQKSTKVEVLKKKYTDIENYNVLILNKKIKTTPNFDLLFAKTLLKISGMPSFDKMGESFINQAATTIIKSEYTLLGVNMGKLQRDYIIKTGGIMLLVTLLSVFCAVSVGFIGAKTSAGTAKTIRFDLFSKVESFSSAEFDRFSTASLITRSTNDITQIQQIIFMTLRMVVYAPLMGIGGFFRALSKAPSMGWIIGIAVIVLLGIISVVISISMPKFKTVQKLVDRLNLVARENLSGLLVVRAFNRQDFEEERFDKVNRDLTSTNLFIARTMVVLMPIISLIMNGLAVSIIWVGSKQVSLGTMQVGDMMAFIQYAMQIVMSFMMMSMVFITLPRASVSGKRVSEVLDIKPSINDKIDPTDLPKNLKGEVTFNSVSFKYPGGEVNALTDISFTAKPGTTTAFIGSTGSGKSSIINLIPRFYDVTKGNITIDGVDIRDIRQEALRDVIGYVPQKNVLFSGTIESNLKYGNKNGTTEDFNLATSTAQATDFILEKDEGYSFTISQDGSNVSGGQRQRLAISRALMKKAPIYIFDDSFSALDFKTDAKLRRDLKLNTGKSTIILVAQRVATIMSAEQIIVLDEGKIVGRGTHKELLKTCPEYLEITTSQLGVQERV
ncbi:ABC transporter ATP-binding protein [Thiospirochaeta perfilievii]|uniref:ABC transporter ATP-binding protein n=1 Tax=Thiospirochaeta perfilievii TaxID=252967 RepID=A0A5C1QCC6_9SPIO|nr:ABC transporter ATP-binding protein [Thiospirochaeta perfilievii]QEN03872.1 ABC transporter ATP-binding protein [Thiospirochaeta perfilievii]